VATEQTEADDMTTAVVADTGTPKRSRRMSGIAAWLRSALFRETSARPLGWRQVLGAIAFVVVGAAVSLARTSGPGALNTIWIEDANNFLQDALHQSVMTTLTTQMNGYYDVVPRALTAIAAPFPLTWVPGIMAAFAALQYAMFGLIVYIASGPHLHSRWLRLLVAAPTCVIPLAYTQVNNDLATVQFIALYGTFWLLLWRPATLGGRIVAPIVMLGVTLSSILPLLFAPLVAARLIADRSKQAIALAGCWAVGLAAQWSVQLRGMSNRQSAFTSPLWVLWNYVTRVVPRALLGEDALGGSGVTGRGYPAPLIIPNMAVHNALIVGAWALLVVAIIIAIARLTAPHWPLAVTALLFSVLLFVGEIVDNLAIAQPRYVIAPALLLYLAIVAMLRPRSVLAAAGVTAGAQPAGSPPGTGQADDRIAQDGRSDDDDPVAGIPRKPPIRRRAVVAWIPVTVFALLLAVVCGFNYRVVNNRSGSPPWTAVVAAASQQCQKPGVTEYRYTHVWWQLEIPCSRVRAS
jgi:hypothetical protein